MRSIDGWTDHGEPIVYMPDIRSHDFQKIEDALVTGLVVGRPPCDHRFVESC